MSSGHTISGHTISGHMRRQSLFSLFLAVAIIVVSSSLGPAVFAQSTDVGGVPQMGEGTPTAFDNPELVKQYQETITSEDLAAHLYVFASDYFEGRETSMRGQKLAAMYLAGQYRKMGLSPKGNAVDHDTFAPAAYFQPVPLYTQRLKSATLQVSQNDTEIGSATYGPDATGSDAYLMFGSMPDQTGNLVFAGYGIADDELEYNDYAVLADQGVDVAGKWVLYLANEPLANDSTSLLPTDDGMASRWSRSPNTKLRSLLSMDGLPAGVLMVGDLGPRAVDVAAEAAESAAQLSEGVGRLSLEPDASGGRPFPPIYIVSSSFADKLIASSGKTTAGLKASIDEKLTPEVFELPDVVVSSTITNEAIEAPSENVVAFIEGSHPTLKNEVVVVSSHYDHIGIGRPNEDGDAINNGADDDGSGTVAVLEMAEAFMKAKADGNGPKRSVLFLNVTGEEKGLLGSRYFTDKDPLVPVESIVTNLNIDMIGRFDPTHPTGSENYVYIIGSNLISQELHDINARVNELTDTKLELDERFNSKDDPNQFYRRSDHWNFGKHSIPFIFFFTGTHEDYHGQDDEAEKIEYDRMARITRLIFATAWQVANQDERPRVTGEGFN